MCLSLSFFSQARVYINKVDDLKINQIDAEIGIEAWRDFMMDFDGSRLMIAITIMALDETVELPDDLKVIKAVAEYEEEYWDMTTTNNKEAYRWAVPYGYSMVFRQGPR